MRIRMLLVGLALTGALAGCGSAAPRGYYNMRTLSTSLQGQIESNMLSNASSTSLTALGQALKTKVNVSCIKTGNQSAECNAAFSDGTSQSTTISISASGSEYITH
jgi:hypothetical protein